MWRTAWDCQELCSMNENVHLFDVNVVVVVKK